MFQPLESLLIERVRYRDPHEAVDRRVFMEKSGYDHAEQTHVALVAEPFSVEKNRHVGAAYGTAFP